MIEYNFDGTYVEFDIVIADSAGLIPQTGMASGLTVTLYDCQSTPATDAATIAILEIGTTGTYRIRTTYSEIDRSVVKDGLRRWTFIHTNPDVTFLPPSVSILINAEIGVATGTPSTTVAIFTGLNDLTTDHYKDSLFRVLTGSNAGEVKKITASVNSGGNVQLTFGAMSAALASSDKIMIINI